MLDYREFFPKELWYLMFSMYIGNSFALFRKKLCDFFLFVDYSPQSLSENVFCVLASLGQQQDYFHGENRDSLENQYKGNYSIYQFQLVCVSTGDQYTGSQQ